MARGGEITVGVGRDVTTARGEPTGEVGQGYASVSALQIVVPSIADLFLHNTRGIEVRFAADTAIPSGVVPGESR
jgi:hypothetical protein